MDFFTPFRAFVLSLQGVNVVYSKLDEPPSFPFGLFVIPLQELNGVNSKYNFPFPHVFGLRRLRTAIRLVRGRKESKLVRSLVLYVKLGVRFLAAVAARVPSFNMHIPCIRTP